MRNIAILTYYTLSIHDDSAKVANVKPTTDFCAWWNRDS